MVILVMRESVCAPSPASSLRAVLLCVCGLWRVEGRCICDIKSVEYMLAMRDESISHKHILSHASPHVALAA
eukprot:scaffold5128_cov104-Isochrysis_galbana.AAC.11